MIAVYRFLFSIFFTPVILLLSLFSPKIRAGFLQKFGKYDFKIKEKTLWIHAVSVGEVLAISDFIKENKAKKIVLTTSTPQGQSLAKNKLSEFCEQICYFPYDYCFAIKNAIGAINPEKIIIVETEIWPNFVCMAKKVEIPVIIANGRISDSTFISYKRSKFFFKNVFKNFYGILAQSKDDAERFIAIGADSNIVQVMGNVKFDIKKPDIDVKELENYYKKNNFKLMVAGSTHGGEEKIIFDSYTALKKDIENLKLIAAPRHLERVEEVSALCTKLKLNFALKTTDANLEQHDVILLNTTGELGNLYSIADVAILGGSFNKTGGHNPLEATIWGKPVLSGANVKNFRVVYRELIKNNCAKIVKDEQELASELKKLLQDETYYKQMCENCEKAIEQSQGATAFLNDYINKI